MSRRHPVRTINQAHELRIKLVAGHANVPGNKLARRVELEQDSVNNHGMNEIHGVLAGQSVHDAIAELHEIGGFLRMSQSPEKLVLAIGHAAAQPFENRFGIAFTTIAS